MNQGVAAINQLPEELIVIILRYLDSPPFSEINARDEPAQSLTVCSAQPLKKLCLVSKRWRQAALPLLFKYACLRLHPAGALQRMSCVACDACFVRSRLEHRDALAGVPTMKALAAQELIAPELPPGIDRYHFDITRDAVMDIAIARELDNITCPDKDAHYENILVWPSMIYHSLRQFLDFVAREGLQKAVRSFLFISEPMSLENLDPYPESMRQASAWRSIAIAAFWQHLFSIISPTRVAVLAPPIELACITSCAIDTFGDWAFGDMDYHFLELRQTHHAEQSRSIEQLDYKTLSFKPLHYPGIAASSILRLRTWSDLRLNEASFLKAYGTYNFFERGPPSLVYSINDSLYVRKSTTDLVLPPLAWIESFTYTAILPFSTHLDFVPLLSCIVTLDLQLAPLPESNILMDRLRVGRAELVDCWSELFSTYETLVRRIASSKISGANCPKLQKFICRDMQIIALQEELDQVFIGLCRPVWAEYERGIFTRLAESAAAAMQGEVY
nr:hypothetical protein CFP56_32132 [Quercus suber]